MESWRFVWRKGIAPLLSTPGLEALRDALTSDDPRLLQGATASPSSPSSPSLQCVQAWPVEGACAVGYCGWQGDGLGTVGEVKRYFAKVCFDADQDLQEPAGCRWFLNTFDDWPREEMRAALLPEVKLELSRRLGRGPGRRGGRGLNIG